MEKLRMFTGIMLTIIIVACSIYAYVERDTLFRTEVNVTYPDGCVETFVNSELVSDECIVGRAMVENNQKMQVPEWNLPETVN